MINSDNFHTLKDLKFDPKKLGLSPEKRPLIMMHGVLGSKTNFFGLKNVEKYSFTMKTLADAISLRNRLIDML